MLKLYSKKAAERIIRRLSPRIGEISARYSLPAPVIKAVLFREITGIDLFDPLADLLVRCNWLRVSLTEKPGTSGRRSGQGKGLFGKLDSSTGYAQIFAFVGIDAVNFALDRGFCTLESLGLPPDRRPDRNDLRDLRYFWHRLKRQREFNLELASLNLLSAAEEVTGRINFGSYSPEELKRIFTRYNGTAKTVTAYGEAAYADYLRYQREDSAERASCSTIPSTGISFPTYSMPSTACCCSAGGSWWPSAGAAPRRTPRNGSSPVWSR